MVSILEGDLHWTRLGFVCMRMLPEILSSLVGSTGPDIGFMYNLSSSWSSVSPQALVLPVCGVSLRKLVPGPPVLSTLMRSMLWARSAPPPCPASPTRRRSRPSTSFWWKWTVSAAPSPPAWGEGFLTLKDSHFLGGLCCLFVVPEPYTDAHRHFIFLQSLVCICCAWCVLQYKPGSLSAAHWSQGDARHKARLAGSEECTSLPWAL